MSLKNKKINSLKYFDWVQITYNDAEGPTYSLAKIDIDSLDSIPRGLDLTTPKEVLSNYWFPVFNVTTMFSNIIITTHFAFERFSSETLTELKQEDQKVLTVTLEGFFGISVQLWFSLPPLLHDLYFLYKKYDKILSERDFILLDFWFFNLSVIDELVQVFEELQLNLHFSVHRYIQSDIGQYDIHNILLLEPTEANLKSLNCENWSKDDYVNYIYNQFSKIDVNIFYEWLLYKKIENIYVTKKDFVYNYLTNSQTGFKSLSLSTLKLLALNPILDLDHVRTRRAEKSRISAEKWAKLTLLLTEEQKVTAFFTDIFVAINNSPEDKSDKD